MNLKDFLEQFEDLPEDYEVVLSACAVPDNNDDGLYVMDAPVVGICVSDDSQEIRLLVSKESCDVLDNIASGILDDIKEFDVEKK